MSMVEIINQKISNPLGILQLGSLIVIIICVLTIITFIFINFVEGSKKHKAKHKKKSIVETGTMFLFFFLYYFLIKFNVGLIQINNINLRVLTIIMGLILIVIGTVVNVKGRLKLGKNWANQIKIYEDHTLVTSGIYGFVRHPLYASLIWMFYGGSLVYLNWSAFLLTTLIFIPFMYYRAKQEEKLLSKQFEDYSKYKQKVGMFFPKIIR